MVAQKYSINFLPMCSHPELSDHAAAIEIINGTSHRSKCKIQKQPKNLQEATQVFSQYSLIITQRFHGIILANMVNVPVISIQHHDKLKNCSTFGVSYYGLNKNLLIDQVNDIKSRKNNNILPIERNSFIDLKQRVNNALCGS
jgi:exopolysaccharide biosynthesis predicted pyruvyltransferase EpsI